MVATTAPVRLRSVIRLRRLDAFHSAVCARHGEYAVPVSRPEVCQDLGAVFSEVPVQECTIRTTISSTGGYHTQQGRGSMSKWTMASPFIAVGAVALLGYGLLAYVIHVLEEYAP